MDSGKWFLCALLCGVVLIVCGCGEKAEKEAKAPPPKPTAPPVEIIIDNHAPDFKIVCGNWDTASRTDGNGSYGEDFYYLYADRKNVGRARFAPKVPAKGVYEVSIYWSADPNRTTKQPVIVHDAEDKDHTYSVNLQQHGNQWFRLGEHVFAPEGCYIEFTNDTDEGYCNADAVKLVGK